MPKAGLEYAPCPAKKELTDSTNSLNALTVTRRHTPGTHTGLADRVLFDASISRATVTQEDTRSFSKLSAAASGGTREEALRNVGEILHMIVDKPRCLRP